MLNVLLTCAGRRHYLTKYFSDTLAGHGKVVGTDMDPTAPALTACGRRYTIPAVNHESYLDTVKDILRKESIDMVFSLNDLEIGLLSSHREELERETGARLYVPPVETFNICGDKWATFRFAEQNDIPAPATFLGVSDVLADIENGRISFPVIVKPRWGSASIGLSIVDNSRDLAQAFYACQQVAVKSSLATLGVDNAVIIQEVISGPEYGVDILYGLNEKPLGFAAKHKLAMRAGETDKAVTVAPERFKTIVSTISHVLHHRGNLDCDFLERDGKLYLLEMNPRFGGGYPFTHLAGANHVKMLIEDYLGQARSQYAYRVGQAFSKCDTLVEVPAP